MDQEPDFYVSPEDLEAQMNAEERGEVDFVSLSVILFLRLKSLLLMCVRACACVSFHR